MSEIRKLSELNDSQLNQAVDVFVEGFYNLFSGITKDKDKLHKIFKHSIDGDMTYAYIQDGEAIGFLGLRTCDKRPITLNKATAANPNEMYVDYLAASPRHRGKGVGTKLIEHAKENCNHEYLMIEVFAKNPGAKKLYERVGFEAIKVNSDFLLKLLGLGKVITMKMRV